MKALSSAYPDTILFDDPLYPITVRPHYSFRPYDPENPSPIFHEEPEIKLILEGESTLTVNGDIYTVYPGDIVIVNPYEPHYTVDTGKPGARYHLYMLSLDFLRIYNPHAPDLRYLLLGEKRCFRNVIRQDERLRTILLSAERDMAEQNEHWQLILNNLMTEFFVLLLRDYVNREHINAIRTSSQRYRDSILPALAYIHMHFAEKISVDVLADLCRFSKCYFCRLFKQVTGETAVSYINRYRLRLAEHIMQTQDLTTHEIARRCGFDDVNYFYRLYKRHFGHTRYRR